jgi:hypothetical protein
VNEVGTKGQVAIGFTRESFKMQSPPSVSLCEVIVWWRKVFDGASYLDQRRVNKFLSNVWEKIDFLW